MSRKTAARMRDDPARVAVVGMAVVIGLLLFALGFVALGFAGFSRLDPAQIAQAHPPPPGPRLEADPAVDLAAVRRQGEARLERYGWVDKAGGVARIPIERAMQITAARGWAELGAEAMRLALILALTMLATGARAAEPFDPFGVAGIDGRPGAQIPLGGVLHDQGGRAVTLRALGHGKPIVLIPVQHRCPNICGATLEGVVRAINAQPARPGPDFELVAFGIDPREDAGDARISADRLTSALAGHPRDGVEAVTSDQMTLETVTHALGYRYAWDPRIGQYAHVAAVAVLTPDGRLTSWLYGVQPPPEVFRTALAAASKGGIGGVAERLLLLCYHYDPVTGRYGPLTWIMLRGIGGAVVLGLAAFIGLSLLGERRRRRTAA